jgi:hypothetical protein
MAGDWFPVRTDLPDDPAVVAIASMTDCIDEDHVVGKLVRLWAWVDRHMQECNAPGVTPAFLNRLVGVTGFAEAMICAGWLESDGESITIPNFHRWFSQSGKKRALTAKRVAKHREKCNANGNAPSVTESLPQDSTVQDSIKKKTTSSSSTSKFTEAHSELAKYLFARIQAVIPGAKPPSYGRWADQIRLLSERDGHNLDTIRQVFDWANGDEFWQANIRSPAKLRKHFPMLQAQMKNKPHGKRNSRPYLNQSGRPAVHEIET